MTESCQTEFGRDASPVTPVASALLKDHTTLRVGGPAKRLVTVTTEAELTALVAECDDAGEPVLILGGGSNMLVADEGFDGTVIRMALMGIDSQVSDCSGANLTVGAGENWDALVARCVDEGWVGVETLSGIPGLVGATPMQNVGAYGADVAQTITSVRTWDRANQEFKTFPAGDCGFGYRTSKFKREPGRWVITKVSYQLRLGDLSAPIAYPELAKALGVEVGERAPLSQVRDVVLQVRRGKGMVLDAHDHDSWSAGSFFTNPILDDDAAAALPPEAPRYPAEQGTKTSAAWLIQNAGFPKGYGSERASLSTKHVLALTNRGEASAADLVSLAREIRAGVEAKFGITLVPEVNLISTSLDAG